MNLPRDRLKAAVDSGFTQYRIAKTLGIGVTTVHNALHGRREVHPKILKWLNLKKVKTISYEIVGECPSLTGEISPSVPEPAVFDMQAAREAAGLPIAQKAEREMVRAVLERAQFDPPTLTIARMQVALTRGLPPGRTWAAFVAEAPAGDVDESWLVWCELRVKQTPEYIRTADAALGGSQELYSHLGPVDRGVDRRTSTDIAVQGGQATGVVRMVMPER